MKTLNLLESTTTQSIINECVFNYAQNAYRERALLKQNKIKYARNMISHIHDHECVWMNECNEIH